jgi:hypothetical protein
VFEFHLLTDVTTTDLLFQKLLDKGVGMTDPDVTQALATTLSKICQEELYVNLLDELNLHGRMLDFAFHLLTTSPKISMLQLEGVVVSMCRLSFNLNPHDTINRDRIADVFTGALSKDDPFLLFNVVNAMRTLASSGYSLLKMLSGQTVRRIASIMTKYHDNAELTRIGIALLAEFSAVDEAIPFLATEMILTKVMFTNVDSEDMVTREVVANTLCNLTLQPKAGALLIKLGFTQMLSSLANASHEIIIELASKMICNLSHEAEFHEQLLAGGALDIVLMMGLVRTSLIQTKMICAKTVLNFVSDENLSYIRESGAVRVFSTLSSMNHPPLQQICSKGIYLLSLTESRRALLAERSAFLQSVFEMVKCQSQRTRLNVGSTVCNLIACPNTTTMMINSGALGVLKIIATIDNQGRCPLVFTSVY